MFANANKWESTVGIIYSTVLLISNIPVNSASAATAADASQKLAKRLKPVIAAHEELPPSSYVG